MHAYTQHIYIICRQSVDDPHLVKFRDSKVLISSGPRGVGSGSAGSLSSELALALTPGLTSAATLELALALTGPVAEALTLGLTAVGTLALTLALTALGTIALLSLIHI